MDLLRGILSHGVFPAVGCTEPIPCANTRAAAAVAVPDSHGRKGSVTAAAMGSVVAESSLRMMILQGKAPRRGQA